MKNKINFHLILYEDNNAFLKGSSEFPLLFKKCFENIEEMEPNFDDELSSFCEFNFKIHQPSNADEIKKIKKEKGFNIFLSGSHSCTYYIYQNFLKEKPALLQFDFHPDLRSSYKKDKNSHASFAKRLAEQSIQIFQIGIGELSIEDRFNAEKFNIYQVPELNEKLINKLPKNIYLSFDADAFSFFNSVTTPGLPIINETIFQQLCFLFEKKNVLAFDLVELLPNETTVMKSALFVRKLLFYKFKSKSTSLPINNPES